MPLSDHEQRLLQQMEQALYAEDPEFAEGLRKPRAVQLDRRRFVTGIGGVLLGMVILVAGVATSLIVVGVLGFLAMIAGSLVAYRAWNGNVAGESPVDETVPGAAQAHEDFHPGSQSRPRSVPDESGESFMNRMEERWKKRREEGGQGQGF